MNLIKLIPLFIVISGIAYAEEEKIEAFKAPFYVGKTVMACGTVADVSSTKKATYINLDKPYPNQTLALLVWKSEESSFQKRLGNLNNLTGQRVCGRGEISEYKKSLQMKLSNPQFLRLMK